MKPSVDVQGIIVVNLVFFCSVIASIVVYIRASKHTLKGLIGVFLIVVITGLYVIINVFFRPSTFIAQHLFAVPPIAITGPIHYIAIKQDVNRIRTIYMIAVIVIVLVSYAVLLFGQ